MYPPPTKKPIDHIEINTVDFSNPTESRDYLQQMYFMNQVKHKLDKDKSFLPKIKTSLSRTGQSVKNTTLREISKTCVSPVSKPANTSRAGKRSNLVESSEANPVQSDGDALSDQHVFMGKEEEEARRIQQEKEE